MAFGKFGFSSVLRWLLINTVAQLFGLFSGFALFYSGWRDCWQFELSEFHMGKSEAGIDLREKGLGVLCWCSLACRFRPQIKCLEFQLLKLQCLNADFSNIDLSNSSIICLKKLIILANKQILYTSFSVLQAPGSNNG
ncbi:unnamed protein product [Cuscuta epithymum]|nr:unnamed protein product [Cuscuta epithymum]